MFSLTQKTRVLFSCLGVLISVDLVAAEKIEDLSNLSLEQLLSVNVIGASKYEQKQSEVAAAVSMISRKEIKAFGWRTLDEILASLPGIHTSSDRQYSYIAARGFGLPGDFNTRVLLTINGNRVNDAVFDQAYIGRDLPIDIDLIDRVEFIPGPGGAVYGQNALFGVINVVTRKGSDVNGTEVAATYHNPKQGGEGRATWGKKFENGTDALVSFSGYQARGEDHFYNFGEAGISGVAKKLDGERDKEAFTHIENGGLSFDFSYGDRRKDSPNGAFKSDPLIGGQYQRDRHLLTQVQYQEDFAENTLHFTSRAFLGRERYSMPIMFDGVRNLQSAQSDWQGVDLRLLSTNFADHKLLFGTEYQANTRQQQRSDDFSTPELDTNIAKSGYRVGVYVQDEWAILKTLTATLGMRVEYNDVIGQQLSPRGGLIWQATSDLTLKGLYGRAHRAPNTYERHYDDGVTQVANPNLNGETIDTLELVADYRWSRNLNLRASLYHWEMSGLIELEEEAKTEISQYQNGDDIKATGVEFSTDTTWDFGGRLRNSVAYQDVSYVDTGARTYMVPHNSPLWLGKLNFSSPIFETGVRLGYEFQYYDNRDTADVKRLSAYNLSNVNLMADKWVKGLELSVGIYNLFDTRYKQPISESNWMTSLDQDGINFRFKALYAF
jgi:iron complex outermembrane receptor protein